MLVSNTPKVNDIVVVRLVSGEEVIGKLLEEDTNSITLGKPIGIQLRMVRPQEAAISFIPFMGSAEETARYVFYRSSLTTAPLKPRADILANYTEMTTGLVVPTSSNKSPLIKP